MRYRTVRRKLARDERQRRTPTPFNGVTCQVCGHYARMIESQGRVQIICNSNGGHKG